MNSSTEMTAVEIVHAVHLPFYDWSSIIELLFKLILLHSQLNQKEFIQQTFFHLYHQDVGRRKQKNKQIWWKLTQLFHITPKEKSIRDPSFFSLEEKFKFFMLCTFQWKVYTVDEV